MFGIILASGKDGGESVTRGEYMRKLAGEIMTGAPAENYRNKAMDRGNEMEPEARDDFAQRHIVELERVGFVRRRLPSGRFAGASPDSLFEKRTRGLEIKSLAPHLLIARLERGAGMPPEHRAQVYGTMWVCGLVSVTLKLFYRGMPVSPEFEVSRDEKEIKAISDAVEVFDWELHKLVARIRAMGGAR